MTNDTIAILTAKSIERILREGGTSAWVLDRNNARNCAYVVCARNRHSDWSEGSEPHGAAFIVGKIADVVPAPQNKGRWAILFSEYAPVDLPGIWQGWRNPVRYTTLKDLGIDESKLMFQPMPEPLSEPSLIKPDDYAEPAAGLTIAEAKAGLAVTFGVNPDAVEIIIRG